MSTEIKIRNKSPKVTEVDIEGIIGETSKTPGSISTYRELDGVLKSIGEINAKTIVVNIRSTGGNVNDAILIYEALSALKCRIITRCYGYVASAATIIAQAASKGRREISKNALYLIHKSAAVAEGNTEEMSKTINLLNKTDERIADIYSERSGRAAEIFKSLMSENNGNGEWLSAKETIEAGLADKVIAAEEISNKTLSEIETLRLPEIPEDHEKHIMKMDIGTRCKAALEAFGVIKEKCTVRNEPRMETAGKEHKERTDGPEQELTESNTIYENGAVTELRNRIVELEALNAKLRAKATQTLPKEDPSMKDFKRKANTEAYEQDIANLKHY